MGRFSLLRQPAIELIDWFTCYSVFTGQSLSLSVFLGFRTGIPCGPGLSLVILTKMYFLNVRHSMK